MSFLAFSGLLNFIVSSVLALFVLFRNYKNPQNRAYFYFSVTIAYYSLGYFFWQISKTETGALFWFKILTIGAIMITATTLHFVFALLGKFKENRRALFLIYFVNIIFVYANLSMRLYTALEPRFGLGLWPVITPIFNFYIIFWFIQFLYGLYWLVRGWIKATGIRREQIKYFTFALAIGITAGSTNWIMWYKIHFYPLTILISLYSWITAYAIIRLKFLDIKTLTVRGIFFLCYCLVLCAPLLYGYLTNNWFFATLLTILAGTLGHLIFKWLVEKTENRLMSYQKQYQQMLKNIAYQVLQYHSTDRLVRHIVQTCTETIKLKNACLFLRDTEKNCYVLSASINVDLIPQNETIPITNSIISELSTRVDHLNIEAAILGHELPNGNEFKNSMYALSKKYGASLVFALRTKDNLLGLLALGPKINGSIFTLDDIDALSLLSCQSALALENCEYLDEIKSLYDKAVTDKLTGCYNRLFYEEYLVRAVRNAGLRSSSLYLAMLDINYFKHLNDSYGHDAGDRVLAALGSTLKKYFRQDDVVVRYGGDEFSVVLKDITRPQCEERIKKLVSNITKNMVEFKSGDLEISIKISVSIGIASLQDGKTREGLFRLADTALFEAKNSGIPYKFSG